jgi:hypothetical protein
MRSNGDLDVTPWWATPVQTRWAALNWPWWARFVVLLLFFGLVNWLIFAPASTFKSVYRFFAHEDKVVHAGIFLTLAFLVRWSFPAGAVRDRFDGWLRYGVPLTLLVYACSTEVLQPLIGGSGRGFEWLDMASNVTGLSTGWLLFGAAVAGANDCFARRSARETATNL